MISPILRVKVNFKVLIGFLVRGRVRIKIRIRVRVGATFKVRVWVEQLSKEKIVHSDSAI